MNIRQKVAMYYRQYGIIGGATKVLSNPRALSSIVDSSEPHFYDRERHVSSSEIVEFVATLTQSDPAELETYHEELLADDDFFTALEDRFERTVERPTAVHRNWREMLYVLMRDVSPENVVETGVYDGLSSSYILHALSRNDQGRLVSIDINDRSVLPSDVDGLDSGWVVPEEWRDRWDLRFGDSRDILDRVAEDTEIDIFLHDSLHTYEHMIAEYETAAGAMGPGAILLSDNINFNTAFEEFSEERLHRIATLDNTEGKLSHDGKLIDDSLGGGVFR